MEQVDNYEYVCPLCNGRTIKKLETIKSHNLIELYQSAYNFDISYLFKKTDTIEINKCFNCSLIYFTPNISGDEKFYNRLQQSPNYYFEDKWEYNIIKNYFSQKMDVLEIGAGEGFFSKLIPYKTYTGLELSKNAVKLAAQNGITIINKKVQDFAKKDNFEKFDIVISFQVLEHVALNELHSFIEASVKLLKKGGKLIICVPSDNSFVGGVPNMTLNLPPHHITRWPDETFKKMEQLFPIKTISIYYEPLKLKNYNAWFSWKLFNLIGVQRKVVRNKTLFIEKISNRLIMYVPKKMKKAIIKKLNARGHSIVVVYEKM